jgi:protein-tyrosine-phosphatase/predicted ATP-grasp superfamily ATP-dependent carboligase
VADGEYIISNSLCRLQAREDGLPFQGLAMARRILVLGVNNFSGLAIVRSLGRAGYEVDVGWPVQSAVTRSRYVSASLDLPQPSDDSDVWVRRLAEVMQTGRYDLVIPANDPAVIPIQSHKEELRSYGRLYALQDAVFLACYDKYRTTLLAQECGVPIPPWSLLASPAEADRIGHDWPLPIVLKPLSTFDLTTNVSELHSVQKVFSRDRLSATVQDMLCDGPVLAQSNFSGTGVGVEVLADSGAILAVFQHERVHEPPLGGGSSYRRSVPVDPILLAAAEALIRRIGHTGVAMLEFRVDRDTGQWVLIEINGRFWGSLPLAIAAGIDFPRFLCEMLLDGKKEFQNNYAANLYCRNLSLDLKWFVQNLRADRRDRRLQTVPLPRIAGELIRHVATGRERLDTFALDDPMPLIYEAAHIASLGLAALRNGRLMPRLRLLKARRQKRGIELIRDARHITFVCKGNIYRSPFAARWAGLRFPSAIEICSAGYYPIGGRRPTNRACMAAGELGVDLAPHRSRVVDPIRISSADVVFVFDHEDRRRMRRDFPRIAARIVSLGDFLPGVDDEIGDPAGGSREQVSACYRRVMRALSLISQACWGITTDNPDTAIVTVAS